MTAHPLPLPLGEVAAGRRSRPADGEGQLCSLKRCVPSQALRASSPSGGAKDALTFGGRQPENGSERTVPCLTLVPLCEKQHRPLGSPGRELAPPEAETEGACGTFNERAVG